MSGFLLDTNILSELRKQSHCDAGVRHWIEGAAHGTGGGLEEKIASRRALISLGTRVLQIE